MLLLRNGTDEETDFSPSRALYICRSLKAGAITPIGAKHACDADQKTRPHNSKKH